MKILIFGAGGMIGHKMFSELGRKGFEVYGTLKQSRILYEKFGLFTAQNSFDGLDILNRVAVEKILTRVQPDVILNCIGITLRKPEIKDLDYCTKVNTEFPLFLQHWVEKNRAYLIHFSTDCVFSGKDGPYTEISFKSATDIYGTTKAAGEVEGPNSLTLRGSMIGRELFGKTELLEWAISQQNKDVKGFSKAIYSGVTTNVMAELVAKILTRPSRLTGVYQVSSEPISKLQLLRLLNQYFRLNLQISEKDDYSSSKVLLSEKIRAEIGFNCPTWPEMVDDLSKDLFKYS